MINQLVFIQYWFLILYSYGRAEPLNYSTLDCTVAVDCSAVAPWSEIQTLTDLLTVSCYIWIRLVFPILQVYPIITPWSYYVNWCQSISLYPGTRKPHTLTCVVHIVIYVSKFFFAQSVLSRMNKQIHEDEMNMRSSSIVLYSSHA